MARVRNGRVAAILTTATVAPAASDGPDVPFVLAFSLCALPSGLRLLLFPISRPAGDV